MAQTSHDLNFRFMYRQGEGVIGPASWARASLPPIAIALALTWLTLFIAPDKPRDLGREAFIDIGVVATHVYFLAYAFALIFSVRWLNISSAPSGSPIAESRRR